jgi:hypothetical protein
MAIDVGPTNSAMSNVIHKKPMSNVTMSKPRLLHESLHVIPQTLRFGATGAFGNVLFLLGYNLCLSAWESPRFPASRIYAIFYCIFIPIAHALNSVLVFGWPQHYLASLVSNAPIGLSAMLIGTACTGYLDQIHFERTIHQFISSSDDLWNTQDHKEQFYSSLIVMAITGLWSYALAMWVNTTPAHDKASKKEL